MVSRVSWSCCWSAICWASAFWRLSLRTPFSLLMVCRRAWASETSSAAVGNAVANKRLTPTPPATSRRKAVPLRPILQVIAPESYDHLCGCVTEPRRTGNGEFGRTTDRADPEINAGYNALRNAGVAQLVERNVANVEVASSRLVS